MADAGDDDDKLTLAQQLFGRTAAILGRHPPESEYGRSAGSRGSIGCRAVFSGR